MFSCFHTTSCEAYTLSRQMDGIFNVCTNLGACCTHEKGVIGHKQVCIRVDSMGQKKLPLTRPSQGRGSNPGSSDLNFLTLTTEPCPPIVSYFTQWWWIMITYRRSCLICHLKKYRFTLGFCINIYCLFFSLFCCCWCLFWNVFYAWNLQHKCMCVCVCV